MDGFRTCANWDLSGTPQKIWTWLTFKGILQPFYSATHVPPYRIWSNATYEHQDIIHGCQLLQGV